MVPGRAGADTHVTVHAGLGQLLGLDGGSLVEQAWLNARAGEPGYLRIAAAPYNTPDDYGRLAVTVRSLLDGR